MIVLQSNLAWVDNQNIVNLQSLWSGANQLNQMGFVRKTSLEPVIINSLWNQVAKINQREDFEVNSILFQKNAVLRKPFDSKVSNLTFFCKMNRNSLLLALMLYLSMANGLENLCRDSHFIYKGRNEVNSVHRIQTNKTFLEVWTVFYWFASNSCWVNRRLTSLNGP